jgi:hypothetical protein
LINKSIAVYFLRIAVYQLISTGKIKSQILIFIKEYFLLPEISLHFPAKNILKMDVIVAD